MGPRVSLFPERLQGPPLPSLLNISKGFALGASGDHASRVLFAIPLLLTNHAKHIWNEHPRLGCQSGNRRTRAGRMFEQERTRECRTGKFPPTFTTETAHGRFPIRYVAPLQRLAILSRNDGDHCAPVDFPTQARVDFPDNLMAKHFDFDYYKSLSPGLRKRLLRCCKSGAENMDSGMGMYAMHPEDYDLFKPYMDKVIRAYHKISGNVHHVTNWELSTKADKLPAGGK